MRTERSRRVVRAGLAVCGLVLLVGWFVFLRPQGLGGPAAYITVSGASMEPTLHEGDLVVLTREPGYEIGQVVAFQVPAGDPAAGRFVIHRIIGGDDHGFRLQGDNVPHPDQWRPGVSDVIGKQLFVVPAAGNALMFLRSPAVIAAVAAALIVFWLPLWNPARPESPAPPSRRSTAP